MYDIDLHQRQKESVSKSRGVQSISRLSKVLDGLLCCVFFGIHLTYRERLEQVHPVRRVSVVDFRKFIQEVLLEWSGKSMLGRRSVCCLHPFHADVNLLVSRPFSRLANLILIDVPLEATVFLACVVVAVVICIEWTFSHHL